MSVRPSEKFLLLVNRVHGSTNAAATAWQIHPNTLYQFMRGKGDLMLESAARIAAKSGLPLDELFVYSEDGKGKGKR